MKNNALDRELTEILSKSSNLVEVTKGNIGGVPTIEIEYKEPSSHDSYIYKKPIDRDSDFNEIIDIIKNNKCIKQN
jgi:hypothetical protein